MLADSLPLTTSQIRAQHLHHETSTIGKILAFSRLGKAQSVSKPVESGNALIDLFDLYKRKGESYSAVSFQHGHEMNEGFALAADYGVFEE